MNLNSTGTDDHELVTRAASAPSMSLEAGQIRAPNDWFEVLSVWSEKTEQMAYVNKPSVPRRHLTVTGASAFMSKIFLKAEHCSTVVPANVEGTFVVVTDEAPATELRTISDFVGPLSDMYPKGVIKKPHRHCAEAWKAAMAVNGSWTGHKAEDSGMVTFWQAMLVASRKVRMALVSLCTLMRHKKLKKGMLEDVTIAAGQLTNCLGLSLEFDHTRNISKIPKSEASLWFNFDGQRHRHDQLLSKIWAVVRRLEECGKAWNDNQCSLTEMEEICDAYKIFHAYLTMTIKVILEDALFFYRQHLDEKQFSCVCHRKYADNPAMDQGMFRTALGFVAAATPAHSRSARFKAMGYGWLEGQQVILFGLMRHRIYFDRPLDSLISSASNLLPSQETRRSSRWSDVLNFTVA